MNFDQAFARLLGHEGVLSKDPTDSGNWTGGKEGVGELRGSKYGISAGAYPSLDIAALTVEDAKRIYRADYWAPAGCEGLPDALKFDVFDFGVNSGPRTAARCLQRVVGAVVDGAIGPKTLMAVANYHPAEVRLRLVGERLKIMAGAPGWPSQGRGWALRIARNALEA